MKMVERMASAIDGVVFHPAANTFEMSKRAALAALKELSEPTQPMTDVGVQCSEYLLRDMDRNDVGELFRAMIDAAIKEAESDQ